MVVLFKVITSLIIAMVWYKLTSNQETAIFFFILMLVIFFISPISYQSPTERQEYLDKFRKSKERQMNIEQLRREEKKKAQEERDKKRSKE
ncbi:hypothetical protein [Helicobacter pullorum]|uniref:hypothetical protein n=1 Tax=Helicobacter pullorum TaxID=35818 RepID=UPI00243166F6|nr:hypothetical protein [Helicobacter pullorum]